MIDPRFRILAELTLADDSNVGTVPIEADWHPAIESLRFQLLRATGIAPPESEARIVPIFGSADSPFIVGVRASLRDAASFELPITYFRSQVLTAASDLVVAHSLKETDLVYRLCAFAVNEPIAAKSNWAIEELVESPITGMRPLSDYTLSSQEAGPVGSEGIDDYPVFIPASILNQAESLKADAEERETGGLLIGYLFADSDSTEVFAEVTALIPAQHAVAETTRLGFSPETWEAANNAIKLRNKQEQYLGWWHSHPGRYWCKCDPEKQQHCPYGKQFFSTDDCQVHRVVFSSAHQIALLTGDKPRPEGGWEATHSLWGWRQGLVKNRGFRILDAEALSRRKLASPGDPAALLAASADPV